LPKPGIIPSIFPIIKENHRDLKMGFAFFDFFAAAKKP
jgi:hypothetical protein